MADQVEVSKAIQHVAVGPLADNISVPKLVMYVLLVPSSAPDGSTRAVTVNTRVIRRT